VATFWLLFSMIGSGIEWQDEGLPVPTYLEHTHRGFLMGYEIDGFFGTSKGSEFLNDIIARFLITFRDQKPKRLEYKPHVKPDLGHYSAKIYKLKQLQNLKSLPPKRKKAPERADSFEDYTFWAIKLYVEDQIRVYGKGNPVPYHIVEDWAIAQFYNHKKGISTVKAKCINIWHWYEAKDWSIDTYKRKYTDEEWTVKREDHIKKVHATRNAKAQAKIRSVLADMFVQDQIRKKNGKLKIGAIAELVEMSEKTTSKHLKEMGLI